MKKITQLENSANHLQNFNEKMSSDAVKQAYFYMISMPGWEWEAHCKGVITDVRYYNSSGEQPYAFIPNKGHLLFYFRTPALSRHTKQELESEFEVTENTAGEWKIRIETPEAAENLARILKR